MVSTSAQKAGDPWFKTRSGHDRFCVSVFICLYIITNLDCTLMEALMETDKKTKNFRRMYIIISMFFCHFHNFCDFLSASLDDTSLPKRSLVL